ncbi:thiazole biosynthesis adenylyltransferase ThiF [Paenibacillus faecis]|uniref:Thiazole biosynthesis adenylyltransferase ThiF n=1 Tax=Paenibacillus faecis TaxID=862114 RepID=A0A5D0CUJ6_9BACL|nr:MoeB/ThiF family adenylyltransferase [Paenibacillus faecis]TYA13601.1 thiazole biosynthesis adenylyltransferase ThiF [Paenibacillus faecis]
MNGTRHDRYSRQKLFPPIGAAGQNRLSESSVLIIGAGALGTAIAETLARAGVGRLILADRDYVEWSNLQRQQLYNEADAAERLPKAVAAERHLRALNSEIILESHVMDVTYEEMDELSRGVNLIMDATDNFDTRLVINDISQKRGIPWIYGGCVGSYGMTLTILPGETPCLNCLLGVVPLGGDTCDTAGVIPPVVQMVVAHQTTEALKLLTGNKDALRRTLLTFDLWRNELTEIKVGAARRADCLSCGEQRTFPYLSAAHSRKTEVLCGRDTVQIRPAAKGKLSLPEVAAKLKKLPDGKVETNPFLLSFSMDHLRLVLFEDGRALVHGTKDISEAKAIYDRYLG